MTTPTDEGIIETHTWSYTPKLAHEYRLIIVRVKVAKTPMKKKPTAQKDHQPTTHIHIQKKDHLIPPVHTYL